MSSFSFIRPPLIRFGIGESGGIGTLAARFGKSVLMITGRGSLSAGGMYQTVVRSLENEGCTIRHACAASEPSPELIDGIRETIRDIPIDCVLSIGGGSVIDAGKAVSAMLPFDGGVQEYLEGVGSRRHPGMKIPFIAAPTTSGTGSEATANAVLSRIGPEGFKKSLRHPNFMPDVAVVDPRLSASCPPPISAACSMDAFTQLLESFVSSQASPITDSLAGNALAMVSANLIPAGSRDTVEIAVRSKLAYGALISGITLTNAGLGLVHGLASAIGGYFEIPHGVVCGTLIAPATKAIIAKMQGGGDRYVVGLEKYARAGAIVSGKTYDGKPNRWCAVLVETLYEWTERLAIPPLGTYGISRADCQRIIAATSSKNSPGQLDNEEIRSVLEERIG